MQGICSGQELVSITMGSILDNERAVVGTENECSMNDDVVESEQLMKATNEIRKFVNIRRRALFSAG